MGIKESVFLKSSRGFSDLVNTISFSSPLNRLRVCRGEGFPGGSAGKNPPAAQGTQEEWVRSLGQKDPLEEEMTTTSVFLPGQCPPWTEEPDGLQSIGSQRVGHD